MPVAHMNIDYQTTPDIVPPDTDIPTTDRISPPVEEFRIPDEAFYPKPQPKTSPKQQPILSEEPPEFMTIHQLDQFALTLEEEVQAPLYNKHGKPHKNISFTGEYRFRHIIPHLINSNYLDTRSNDTLDKASFLVRQYRTLHHEYSEIDIEPGRGFKPYENFRNEKVLNKDRIRLHSAALLQTDCNIEKLVRRLGGPHLATHRNVTRILRKLKDSVEPVILEELKRVFTYGSPKQCNAHNTEENLQKFYDYGNHSSVDDNPDIFMKTLIKDSRRGNTLLFDDRFFSYIPNVHLTPQGIASLDDKWKQERAVFDSSFRPDLFSFAINDWTSKLTEPEVQFPGSFLRLLIWIWNLRISYPHLAIFLGDNDVTNAFRLIKNNPGVVAMCGYRACGLLGFATGQTFGNCYSPANFEPAAIARQQHAQWLWTHKKEAVLERSAQYVSDIVLTTDPSDLRPFAKAEKDALNLGVFNADNSRKPPTTPMQVDDCLYADVAEHFPLTVAASIASLMDVFDGIHPFQESPLSDEKLNSIHKEQRVLLGHEPDTRSMTVKISPRRVEKILKYLSEEKWITPNKKALIKEIATVAGLIGSAAEYFPWAKAQLLILYDLLRKCISEAYDKLCAANRFKKRLTIARNNMPSGMAYRLKFVEATWKAQHIWRNKRPIQIPDDVRKCLQLLYKYLQSGAPWERPIGHIVPRVPNFISTGDASEKAIGVQIPRLKIWCILPFSKRLCDRIAADEVHINSLEFIAILISYIMVQEKYKANPSNYPPSPTLLAFGDNTTANAWWEKMSTHSKMGQNLLKLYAEYQLLSPVCSVAKHIKGTENVVADAISRPDELFTPHLTHIYDTPYSTLVTQVCQQYKAKRQWELFLISAELLSVLNSALSCDSSWERPKKAKNNGRFVHVGRTFYGGQNNAEFTNSCFL